MSDERKVPRIDIPGHVRPAVTVMFDHTRPPEAGDRIRVFRGGVHLGTATLNEPDRRRKWRFRTSRFRRLLHRLTLR